MTGDACEADEVEAPESIDLATGCTGSLVGTGVGCGVGVSCRASGTTGSGVSISVDGGTVMINDARVLLTDIEASNGTIHVIDAVLIPPQS